jgi:5-methyltetrahydropteroyltriglutamate--homocysteine methyltransferase
VVEGNLHEGSLDLVNAYRRMRPLTQVQLKFTVTGPHMLSKTLLDRHYKDLPALAHALAEVLASQIKEIDADVVQIDEANLPGAPEEWEWAVSAINVMLDAIPKTPAVHLCFGNYGGQSIQKGSWANLLSYLNALHADHVVLEFAHRGYGELEYFKGLRPEMGIGLGVVDIKSTVIESPELIAKRLEQSVNILGENRIRYIHPDCGFWMLNRSIANAKIRSLTLGRDLFEGR